MSVEGAVRRGRGVGRKNSRSTAYRTARLGFDIAGGLRATALEVGVWVEMVTEGGRRFMAGLRKGEIL